MGARSPNMKTLKIIALIVVTLAFLPAAGCTCAACGAVTMGAARASQVQR